MHCGRGGRGSCERKFYLFTISHRPFHLLLITFTYPFHGLFRVRLRVRLTLRTFIVRRPSVTRSNAFPPQPIVLTRTPTRSNGPIQVTTIRRMLVIRVGNFSVNFLQHTTPLGGFLNPMRPRMPVRFANRIRLRLHNIPGIIINLYHFRFLREVRVFTFVHRILIRYLLNPVQGDYVKVMLFVMMGRVSNRFPSGGGFLRRALLAFTIRPRRSTMSVRQ